MARFAPFFDKVNLEPADRRYLEEQAQHNWTFDNTLSCDMKGPEGESWKPRDTMLLLFFTGHVCDKDLDTWQRMEKMVRDSRHRKGTDMNELIFRTSKMFSQAIRHLPEEDAGIKEHQRKGGGIALSYLIDERSYQAGRQIVEEFGPFGHYLFFAAIARTDKKRRFHIVFERMPGMKCLPVALACCAQGHTLVTYQSHSGT